ncbi:MAG: hypothetical protein H0A75_06120 [Candidatus Methanofishera endochildressiae]|uniref:Uncharacterized protein n=1 Tax=Candidatus Methanofishera endochildressiae TaxID=2738884 RepID=A0A7Z0MPJ2_9GAMM|nr:hypothetical protein [Candidatus Methanofishera endochildressiae]
MATGIYDVGDRPRWWSIFADKQHHVELVNHHRKQFGFVYQDKPLIIESLGLEVIAKNATLEQRACPKHSTATEKFHRFYAKTRMLR